MDIIQQLNETFKGQVIQSVEGLSVDSERIKICFINGHFELYHEQACCENVYVEDVSGVLDLSGAMFIELVEKITHKQNDYNDPEIDDEEEDFDSHTWTFYTLKTSKGYTDIRWHGTSNGYYSNRLTLILRCTNGTSTL